jgi:two-component system, LytTR family, sensor kinase
VFNSEIFIFFTFTHLDMKQFLSIFKNKKFAFHLGIVNLLLLLMNLEIFDLSATFKVFSMGLIVGSYIIIYVLMPRFFFKQYLGIYLLLCLLMTVIISWLGSRFLHSENSFFINIIAYIFLFGILTNIVSIWNNYRNTLKINNLQKLQTQTELNFLKAQVNPHFLFNTLNNLYATARIESPTTASGLLKLSDLMRYMFTKANQETVLLTEEVAYLDSYIDLEKMRLNEGTHVAFLKKGDFKDVKIAPMLLLPFIENAFKHGAEKQLDNIFIDINLSLQGKTLYFQVENNKQFDDKHPLSIGAGLENVKKRFGIGYPNQHNIDIQETSEKFNVKLWINL